MYSSPPLNRKVTLLATSLFPFPPEVYVDLLHQLGQGARRDVLGRLRRIDLPLHSLVSPHLQNHQRQTVWVGVQLFTRLRRQAVKRLADGAYEPGAGASGAGLAVEIGVEGAESAFFSSGVSAKKLCATAAV